MSPEHKGHGVYTVCAFAAGLTFGVGLIVSQMVDPAKVLGFLDVAGKWDPSLALVMAGAVSAGGIAFAIAKRRATTLLGTPLQLPRIGLVDRHLIGGSALFGIGWGLAGFCPGPAVVSIGAGQVKAVIFVIAMLAGMTLFEIVERLRARGSTASTASPAATK